MNTDLIEQLDALMQTMVVIVEHIKRAAAQGGPMGDLRRDLAGLEHRISRLEAMHNVS